MLKQFGQAVIMTFTLYLLMGMSVLSTSVPSTAARHPAAETPETAMSLGLLFSP